MKTKERLLLVYTFAFYLFTFALSYRVIFGVRVGCVRGYDVAQPAQCSARAYPEAGREDEPENTSQNTSVVELADAGNKKAQDSCQKWIAHYFISTSAMHYTQQRAPLFNKSRDWSQKQEALSFDYRLQTLDFILDLLYVNYLAAKGFKK